MIYEPTRLDLGKQSAKYASTDELVGLMRQTLRQGGDMSHSDAIKAYLERVRGHEDYETVLLPAMERYVANALWRRCVLQDENTPGKLERMRRETKDRAKAIIASEIVLWTWKLPTTDRPLSECTFREVGEAAPLSGRFLSKLSTQGAPGSLVKEVFTKDELQDFWAKTQGPSAA